jgi:pyruvate/2-oxoglutarate/acetoin dehydrogenase E1 component
MSAYFDALCQAMNTCAKDPRTVFIGQAVRYNGTAMFATLRDVPMEQRIEFPVAENFQMGTAIGISLGGYLPICIFPRWNFLLCAMDQLILHLDKLPIYSHGGYRPKVIIRTAVATPVPLDPGPQHLGDYTEAVNRMLATVQVRKLLDADDVREEYQAAMERDRSTILVEMAEQYA